MSIGGRLSLAVQAIAAPQICVLCQYPALRADWAPLCRRCGESIRLPPPDEVCLFCGDSTGEAPGTPACRLCGSCQTPRSGFDLARAAGEYRDPLRALIQAFKFRGLRRLCSPLGDWMAEAFLDAAPGWRPDWVVAIPLHPRRRRERGFDQTELLARTVARRLGLPLRRVLRRRRHTTPQSGLHVDDRRRNVRNAFCALPRFGNAAKRVLLIDDVLTTGTTAAEAAQALKNAGAARSVFVLTAARAPRYFPTLGDRRHV